MAGVEHRVGIHDVTWYPKSSFMNPEQIGQMAKNSGADFFVHMPGWRDILVNKKSYSQVSSWPAFIDDSWWIDRAVEIVTPLPNSRKLIANNVAVSTAYPIYPLSKILTRTALKENPEAPLIRRWPVFDSKDQNQMKRNKIIELMSPKVVGFREVLDVHSINIGLTTDELLDWQRQKTGRRLMISALMVDERLEKYGLPVGGQEDLIHPLIGYVSVVNLKIGDLKDQHGNILMTEKQVSEAIISDNVDNLYARRLVQLSEQVGRDINVGRINWIIKAKPGMAGGPSDRNLQTDDFLKRYVGFVKKVLQ
jgi:hypothetical protein